MSKISELKKQELQAEDIMFVVERKDQFNGVRLADVMDKYALEFAEFAGCGKVDLEKLLSKYKSEYLNGKRSYTRNIPKRNY